MAKQGSHLKAALAVFWSFFGIRKRQDYEADAEHLKPAQIIIAGLIGAIIFVGVMLLIVNVAMRFL